MQTVLPESECWQDLQADLFEDLFWALMFVVTNGKTAAQLLAFGRCGRFRWSCCGLYTGSLQLASVTAVTPPEAMVMIFAFSAGDLIKVLLAAALAQKIRPVIKEIKKVNDKKWSVCDG